MPKTHFDNHICSKICDIRTNHWEAYKIDSKKSTPIPSPKTSQMNKPALHKIIEADRRKSEIQSNNASQL